MSVLAVTALAKTFGGLRAISDVTFSVPEGGIYAVIGPNGAGKTTLLNLLNGVYRPSGGRIQVGQHDLTGAPPHRFAALGVARTFQTPQIFGNMSAIENVMVGRHCREQCRLVPALLRLPRVARTEREGRAAAAELMAFVGLGEYVRAEATELPYGAMKRLEIARALAPSPDVLLLDEPAAGLNPSEAHALTGLIARIAAGGVTVVLVEHNMHVVASVSHTVLVLDHGMSLAEGPMDEVRRDARVIEAYLGTEAGQDAGSSLAH